jgi:hypothetical protein
MHVFDLLLTRQHNTNIKTRKNLHRFSLPVYLLKVISAARHAPIKDVVQRESLSINTQLETTVASLSLPAQTKMRLRG